MSYNKEQAVGDGHNFVAMVMNETKVDLEGALGRLAEEHKERVDRAVELWPRALSLPCATAKVAKDLAFYVDHLMGWPRGNDCWSFESGRYFGEDGLRVQKERVVELLPRKKGKDDTDTVSLATDRSA